jgi:hypothetical protein
MEPFTMVRVGMLRRSQSAHNASHGERRTYRIARSMRMVSPPHGPRNIERWRDCRETARS